MTMRCAFAALLCLAAPSAVLARDALLEAALARPALPVSDVQGTIRTTTTVGGGDKPEVETETIDPRKEPRKALASYAELKDVIGQDAHVVSQGAGRTTYAFSTRRLPRGFTQAGTVSVDMDGKDEDELFDGKAEVRMDAGNEPYVSHLDLRLHETAGNWLARVKRIDVSYVFGPAANAKGMLATAMSVDVDVRALFFVHRAVHADSVLVAAAPKP